MKKIFMKRLIPLMCIFCLLFSIAGCGSKEELPPIPSATPLYSAPTVEAVVSVQDENLGENTSAFDTTEIADQPSTETSSEPASDSSDDQTIAPSDTAIDTTPTVKVKGIYVTGPMAGSAKIDELIELVKTTELNTMVIDVKNDEDSLTYAMEVPESADIDQSVRYISDLPGLLEKLHSNDIYVIARVVCFKDPKLAEAKPETALCSPEGKPVTDANGNAWVNPYKKEVWEYLCTVAECAIRDGFDEIQFDYVRFPIGTEANMADYGVDTTTYTRETGLSDFFTYTSERLHKSGIIFGADLFGTIIGSEIDRDRTGQNYLTIAEKTDAICPMIYPSHYAAGTFNLSVPDAHPYETISGALELSHEELDGTDTKKGAVRPWLQCFNAVWVDGHITYGSKEIKEQIQAVYDAGYEEWILWNASNRYDQVKDALNH